VIHFIVLPVPTVHLDDGGLVTMGIGVRGRATECLGPVSGEPLDVLGVETVAECVGDYVVGHYAAMPGVGETTQAVVATCRLEDSLHAFMMTILPCLCKTMARRVQLGSAINGTCKVWLVGWSGSTLPTPFGSRRCGPAIRRGNRLTRRIIGNTRLLRPATSQTALLLRRMSINGGLSSHLTVWQIEQSVTAVRIEIVGSARRY
jgi:hypothetical protein